MHLELSSAKWLPFFLGLDVLNIECNIRARNQNTIKKLSHTDAFLLTFCSVGINTPKVKTQIS